MTTPSAAADDGPRRLLADSRQLARRVRAEQRATWFPLFVFAAVTFAAIPVYRYGSPSRTCGTGGGGTRACLIYSRGGLVYWPIALLIAYALIATFYVRRGRARGLGTRTNRYVVAGMVLALLMGFASVWTATHPPLGSGILGLSLGSPQLVIFAGFASAATAIGLALLLLAIVERSWALAVLTLVYLCVALAPATLLRNAPGRVSVWAFLPRLLVESGILLVGAIVVAVVERSKPAPVDEDAP